MSSEDIVSSLHPPAQSWNMQVDNKRVVLLSCTEDITSLSLFPYQLGVRFLCKGVIHRQTLTNLHFRNSVLRNLLSLILEDSVLESRFWKSLSLEYGKLITKGIPVDSCGVAYLSALRD